MEDKNKIWEQIQKEYAALVAEHGVDVNDDYQQQLLESLGMSPEALVEMEKDAILMVSSKTIKVKRVHPDAVLPKYAYPSDSGFDLHSVEDVTIPALGRALVPTGICVEIDENFEIQVRPKSGLAINQGLTVLNTPGTVDAGYNGEIKVIVFNTNNGMVTINKGMKIAQAVLCPVVNGKYVIIEEVNELGLKDRGDNGFGSTGI